jgi:hypothetical protein
VIDSARLAEIYVAIDRMQQCVEEIHRWCASRRLQLNPSKTEVIWFGSKTNLKKIQDMDLALRVGTDVIQPAKVVRDLGVLLDQELTMKQHISKVTRACFFPTAPSETGSSSTRSRSNCQSRLGVRYEQT